MRASTMSDSKICSQIYVPWKLYTEYIYDKSISLEIDLSQDIRGDYPEKVIPSRVYLNVQKIWTNRGNHSREEKTSQK